MLKYTPAQTDNYNFTLVEAADPTDYDDAGQALFTWGWAKQQDPLTLSEARVTFEKQQDTPDYGGFKLNKI